MKSIAAQVQLVSLLMQEQLPRLAWELAGQDKQDPLDKLQQEGPLRPHRKSLFENYLQTEVYP